MPQQRNATGFRWTVLLRPRWVICIFVGLLALLRVAVELMPTRIEIGPETTVLNGPLRSDGTVDYVTIVDQLLSQGVTPDENAVVDLLKAFGPALAGSESPARFAERLGVEEMSPSGPYFVSSDQFLSDLSLTPDSNEELAAWQEFFGAEEHPWTADEFPLVAQWIERNSPPLEHILAATRKPKYYAPVVVDPGEPYLHTWDWQDTRCCRNASRMLSTRALLEVGEGRPADAFEYAIALHRVARLVSQSPNALFGLPSTFEAIALTCDEAIVLSEQLSVEEIRRCRRQLASLPDFADAIEQFDTVERYQSLDAVQAIYQGRLSSYEDPPRAGCFDPNPALRLYSELYDGYGAAFRLADRDARIDRVEELDLRFHSPPELTQFQLILRRIVGGPMVAGQEFADRLPSHEIDGFTGTNWMNQRINNVEARVRLVECAYALAESRAVHGDYPDALGALVPEFVESVPLDPFSGAPLRYRRIENQFVLYSVGENEVDDGGIDTWTALMLGVRGDDLVFGFRPESDDE